MTYCPANSGLIGCLVPHGRGYLMRTHIVKYASMN